jgi:hypothetical protein
MPSLPRVTELTRERISREFDDVGPEACLAGITRELREHNPELLDIASKCAADVGDADRVMIGFGMFYRLLIAAAPAVAKSAGLSSLPRVTGETRDRVVAQIDSVGPEDFTQRSIEVLDQSNPELLQMAHNFASRHRDYLGVMQGFALLYRSLMIQAASDRTHLH